MTARPRRRVLQGPKGSVAVEGQRSDLPPDAFVVVCDEGDGFGYHAEDVKAAFEAGGWIEVTRGDLPENGEPLR